MLMSSSTSGVWVNNSGRSLLDIELDGRTTLIPLGLTFEDRKLPRESTWIGPDPESDNNLDIFGTHHTLGGYERLEDVYLRMRGPTLRPYSLEWARGEATGSVPLRGPRRTWDCVTIHFAGASCPELFIRRGEGSWSHWGPLLVGAEGLPKRRRERRRVGQLPAGQPARLVLREVPGEVANIEVILWAVGETRRRLDAARCLRLDAHSRVELVATAQPEPVELELEIDGYFERTPKVREAHP